MIEQAQMGDSGDWSDNGRLDKGKVVIPGTIPEIQEVDSVKEGDFAYVKDDIPEIMGKGYGNVCDISEFAYVKDVNAENVGMVVRDISNKESNPIWETGTAVSTNIGVDESSTLNLKGYKERQMDPISNELPIVRPKSTWTRINRMDFRLGGFTKNLVLPTLGKREAPQNVMPNLDVSHTAPSFKRGKFNEVNIDEISVGVESHPCRKQ